MRAANTRCPQGDQSARTCHRNARTQPRRRGNKLLSATAGLLFCGGAAAEGHGPAFGLATPTLGQGQWSSDTVVMNLETEEGTRTMAGEMLGYGITEDLQAVLTFPVARTGDALTQPPRIRGGAMMPALRDVEGQLLWRFRREAPSIGTRRESAALFGASVPTDDRRGGVEVGPSLSGGIVTGYASRTVYWWVGGGYQYYFEDGNDRLGDLTYLTAVFGWRPPVFRGDYPKPDWRIFVEALAEHSGKHRNDGMADPNSGGMKRLAGPSVLGLFGSWGVEAGMLFPVSEDMNGTQPEEKYRAKLVLTYWF